MAVLCSLMSFTKIIKCLFHFDGCQTQKFDNQYAPQTLLYFDSS